MFFDSVWVADLKQVIRPENKGAKNQQKVSPLWNEGAKGLTYCWYQSRVSILTGRQAVQCAVDTSPAPITVGGDMPLFLIYLFYRTVWRHEQTYTLFTLFWLDEVDWMHLEVGLKWTCWLCAEIYFGSLRSKSVEKLPNFPPAGLEPMPHVTVALTAQYLNVRQRKLGTIIIQTVRILQHESAVTDSLPEEEFMHGHSNLLPNDLACQ